MRELERRILNELLADFHSRKLTSTDLEQGYTGPTIDHLKATCTGHQPSLTVDFDLIIKDLEKKKIIKTGPMEPFRNDPNSGLVIVAIFSKYEYAYLTAQGYRSAKEKDFMSDPRSGSTVTITGGTFHQSPVGVGSQVSQSVTVNIGTDSEAVSRLLDLLTQSGMTVDDAAKKDVAQLVDVTTKGDVAAAKPIFQRLFGATKSGIKEVAWGVVANLIAKQLGI